MPIADNGDTANGNAKAKYDEQEQQRTKKNRINAINDTKQKPNVDDDNLLHICKRNERTP